MEDSNKNWLAVGEIEDTGNFIYQKAALGVSCVVPTVDSTDYKFVPIPIISTFAPKEGQAGGPLSVYGNVLADISAVSISGVSVSFQVESNTFISGTIPAGAFNNKIQVVGPSGVIANSTSNFITLENLGVDPDDDSIKITPNQSIRKPKGYTSPVSVLGKNFSGLNTAYTIHEETWQSVNLISNPDFSYTSTNLQIPISGLKEGLHSLTVGRLANSDTANRIINIIEAPKISYAFQTVMTTGLINEPQMYSSSYWVTANLQDKKYQFNLTDRANKICLEFDNEGIKDGSIKYELEKDWGNNANTTAVYYIDGLGATESKSKQHASNMFGSGIYTRDFYGDPFDQYSYRLYSCVCDITLSGTNTYESFPDFTKYSLVTGVLTGDINHHPTMAPVKELCRADFATYADSQTNLDCLESGFSYSSGIVGYTEDNEISLSASGATTGITVADIQSQLQSYPNYEITNYIHEAFTNNETGYFNSGISFPYSTSLITNHDSQPWRNILHSGIKEIYPAWPNVDSSSLVSGFNVINSGEPSLTDVLVVTGKNEAAASGVVEYALSTSYSQCETGNYSAEVINVTGTTTSSGTMYGWSC